MWIESWNTRRAVIGRDVGAREIAGGVDEREEDRGVMDRWDDGACTAP